MEEISGWLYVKLHLSQYPLPNSKLKLTLIQISHHHQIAITMNYSMHELGKSKAIVQIQHGGVYEVKVIFEEKRGTKMKTFRYIAGVFVLNFCPRRDLLTYFTALSFRYKTVQKCKNFTD